MLRRLNVFHWFVLGLAGLLLVFAIARPFAARAAVGLIDMTATAQTDGTILVEWETATELNTAAFNLYRAETSTGPWDTIVDAQPAQGDGTTGATYIFTDYDVEAGKTYYYLLEEVDSNGTRTKLEGFIVCATALVPGQATFTPTPTATRTATPDPSQTPTRTPTPTLSADRTIYLPLLLRTN